MLKVNNLQFEQAEQKLFQPINLDIQAGTCVQLAGANGIGKTTILKILAGITAARRGRILWQDKAIPSLAAVAKYLGHEPALNSQLSVLENLHYYADIFHAPKASVAKACAFFDLLSLQSQWIETLSAGQKHRCQLAKLLIGTRPIWLLDEPCTALDHTHIQQLITLFHDFLTQGGIIIFTSHQIVQTQKFRIETHEIQPYEG